MNNLVRMAPQRRTDWDATGAAYPVTPRGLQRRVRLGRALALAALVTVTSLSSVSCVTTPVTGRSAFNLFNAEQDVELGREAFQEIKAQSNLVTSGPEYDLVQRTMDRLTPVVEDNIWEWETIVIDEPGTVNAFALPGGKMAVYTGILPVAQSEEGLAVVLGHEIGHVVARHGTERLSRTNFSEMGVDAVSSLLGVGDYQALFQMGAQVLIDLPFSRSHEAEADEIGLIYMARAGYDPRAAPAFWNRMEQLGGAGPPEFLSTHPSAETRQERLNDLMPKALEVYRGVSGP